MSKAAKTRRHSAKMRAKRAAKAQRRAAYEALRGTSKKRKKISARSRGATSHKHMHLVEHCGNPGCERCYPEFRRIRRNEAGR